MAGIRCLPSSTWLHPTHTSHFFKRSFFGRISIGQIPSWSHLCSGLQSSRALSIAVAASSTVKAQNGTVRVKGNKPRSSKLVDLEYAELNLKEKVGEVGAVRVRQHVNPLKASLMVFNLYILMFCVRRFTAAQSSDTRTQNIGPSATGGFCPCMGRQT
eukprot:Gb_18432 [translate_table: standard]